MHSAILRLARTLLLSVVATLPTMMQAQVVDEIYEIRNRVGRSIPVAIVPVILHSKVDVAKLSMKRCSNGQSSQDVPFYVEPWTIGTDSTVCWVRINDLGGGERVTVQAIITPTQTVSKSNGSATFLAFSDNITPRTATSATGPLSVWTGAKPEFGSGLIIEARMQATAEGGGLFGYFGANAQHTAGFVVHHSAIEGSTDPDHFRVEGGSSNQITPAFFRWRANEPVRYNIRLTADSNIIIRTSEQNNQRVHQLRTLRSETDWEWTTFGAASFSSHPNTLRVDWVHVRPWIELPPTVTRKNSDVTVAPSNGVICNGVPVVLTGPSGWAQYAWSNGATTPTIQATSVGTLSLTVSDNAGCSITLPSVAITRDTIPSVGRDTAFTLCLGRSEVIRVPEQYDSYRWYISTGQKQALLTQGVSSIRIDSADVYTCIVGSAGGCSDTMQFRVSRVFDTTARITASNPQLSLCAGDSLTLYASPPNATYRWYRDSIELSERGDRLIVTQAGQYTVAVRIGDTTNTCLSFATVTVRENERQRINLNASYRICEDSVLRIGVPDTLNYPTFEWSTGAVQRSISIRESGEYWVYASYNGTCGDTARFSVEVRPSPAVEISVQDNRTSMCTGESLVLTATAADSAVLLWNHGATGPLIVIREPGTYIVRAVYPNGCDQLDTVRIDDGLAVPDIISLDYQTLCPNQSTRLTTVGRFDTYLWSTGETADTIMISQPGNYWVEVTLFECSARREFSIKPTEPGGLVVEMRDTVGTCPVSPLIPFTVISNQDVERYCVFTVLTGPATPLMDTINVGESSSASNAMVITSGTPPGIYTIRYRMEDNCGWSQEFSVTTVHGARNVDVGFAIQSPVATSVRAGDNIAIELRGADNSGLQRFFRTDTVLLTVKVNPDLFHLTSANSSCADQRVVINDTEGTVTYILTNCAQGSVTPFITQQATVLVGTTLDAWVKVEEVRGTNPCFEFPFLTDAVPISAYGCTISTIERATAPVINVIELGNDRAEIQLSSHSYPVVLRCIDPVGRTHDELIVHSADDAMYIRHPNGPFFLQAGNQYGTSHIAIVRAE